MSFSRVKPDNWAVNEKLTSAQQNQLDIDHAKAVDKTGDTITGNVHIGSGAFLTVDSGGQVKVDSGGQIRVDSGGAYNAQSGSNTNFLSGASATFNDGSTLAMIGTMAFFGGDLSFDASSTFATACVSQFTGNVEFNGSGVLGSMLVKVQTGADVRVKTGSRIYVESGGSLVVANGAGVDVEGTIAFAATHISSYAASSQIFHQGITTHLSTNVDTYATGSQTVHATASTDTYQNGALLTQSSGSIWTMGGVTNLASGGALNLQSGSAVTFTSVPTLGNGFTASAGTSSIAGTLNVSATANFSGTTTLTGSSNRLKLTSRSVTKRLVLSRALVIASGSPVSFNYDTANDTVEIGSGTTIILDLDIPNNAVVTEIEYTWTGTGNTQAAFRANAAVVTGIASHSSPGTYTISATETILRATTSYRFTFTETASNVPKLTSVFVTYTVTEYSEG